MANNINPITLVNTILIGIIFLSLVGVLDISSEKKKVVKSTYLMYPERNIVVQRPVHNLVPYYNQPIRMIHPRRLLRPHFSYPVKKRGNKIRKYRRR